MTFEPFTVKKLIEILQTFPADTPVLVSGYKNGFDSFYHPELLDLVHQNENTYLDGEYQIAKKNEKPNLAAVVLQRIHRDD